jgi:hypothetical protein
MFLPGANALLNLRECPDMAAESNIRPNGFAPEQVRHRGGGGVVPPERTQVEDGLDSYAKQFGIETPN